MVTIVKRHHQLFNFTSRPAPYASSACRGYCGEKFLIERPQDYCGKVIVLDHHAGASSLHSVLLLNVTMN